MYKIKWGFIVGLLLVLLLMLSGWVEQVQCQQKYPTRGIDIIVTFGPGGMTDLATRIVGAYLSKKWDVPVNVINKPGGNSVPGCLEVFQAAPDGYTILAEAPNTIMLELTVRDLPFKVLDRTFIGSTASGPMILSVPANSPYKDLQDLVADIKKDPENFRWGAMGGATGTDIIMRQLCKAIGVDILKTKPVNDPSSAKLISMVAGGAAKMTIVTVNTTLPLIKNKLVKGIFVTGKKRHPDVPDVPTTTELGYPTVEYVQLNGLSGPPKLPVSVVDAWDKALEETLTNPDVISKLRNTGQAATHLNSTAFREEVRREIQSYGELYGLK